MNGKTRVLVVNDHTLLRRVLCERLAREPDFVVLDPAATADEAVTKTVEGNPHVILMNIDIPGLSCFDAARRIQSLRPETRIVFLTAFTNDRYIEQALAVHASGYLTKRDPPETVVAAIREVASGGVYFCEEVRARIVVGDQGAKLATPGRSPMSKLTRREMEVLRYVASGMSQKAMAASMSISTKTVENHCTNLMNKLDIHDRVELTRFAIREGIVQA